MKKPDRFDRIVDREICRLREKDQLVTYGVGRASVRMLLRAEHRAVVNLMMRMPNDGGVWINLHDLLTKLKARLR